MTFSSLYTEELGADICGRIAEGQSLNSICKQSGYPHMTTVLRWLQVHPDFLVLYQLSREAQAETMAEEIISIADDSERDTITDNDGNEKMNAEFVARSRLRVESRKWLASKLLPKKYGDRVTQDITHTGRIDTLSDDDLQKKITELMAKNG